MGLKIIREGEEPLSIQKLGHFLKSSDFAKSLVNKFEKANKVTYYPYSDGSGSDGEGQVCLDLSFCDEQLPNWVRSEEIIRFILDLPEELGGTYSKSKLKIDLGYMGSGIHQIKLVSKTDNMIAYLQNNKPNIRFTGKLSEDLAFRLIEENRVLKDQLQKVRRDINILSGK